MAKPKRQAKLMSLPTKPKRQAKLAELLNINPEKKGTKAKLKRTAQLREILNIDPEKKGGIAISKRTERLKEQLGIDPDKLGLRAIDKRSDPSSLLATNPDKPNLIDEINLTPTEITDTKIPTKDDPVVQEAGRDARLKAMRRFGRRATILTSSQGLSGKVPVNRPIARRTSGVFEAPVAVKSILRSRQRDMGQL